MHQCVERRTTPASLLKDHRTATASPEKLWYNNTTATLLRAYASVFQVKNNNSRQR
ncbi:hypothetical protein [Anoxynatronum sibiricum]|uniref:Uncharacterized protein n=1 Tax=Anoxynatronum sibiricum TaxID=210623 RepID=A0ABU9VTD0_9CLOT